MGRDEEAPQLFWNVCHLLDGRMRRQIGLDFVEIEAAGLCLADEGRMTGGEHDAVHDAADFLHPVERFNAW